MRDGKIVGIISRANLMRALVSIVPGLPAMATSDAEIRKQLLANSKGRSGPGWSP